jgi:gliding motility-associated-like protein
MRSLSLMLLCVLSGILVSAQNPATVFTIPNRNITLPCGVNCTSISVSVPHIKQTDDYVVTNPPYLPYAYTTPTGTELTFLYQDDYWSDKISFPFAFSFCYYGINYPKLLVGSNSAITFDTTRAATGSGYSISSSGGGIPNSAYAPSMIFGPYHDINPNLSSTYKKIEWRVEGIAPKRRFIASYNDVPYFGSSCTEPRATHQMVLYENTGVIEVYIHDKPYCTDWNSGLSILGVQNSNQTKAVSANGKNATVWGSAGMDSCFRFTPSAGTPMYKRAQLLVNNVVVATAGTSDTATTAPAVLSINFPNVCPAADSTAYVVRVTYGSCSNPALEVSFDDTVYVKKQTAPTISTSVANSNICLGGSTTATTTSTNTTAYSWSPTTGVSNPAIANPALSPTQTTTYTVTASNSGTCTAQSTVTVNVSQQVTANAGPDQYIIQGDPVTLYATASSGSYLWTPATGLNSATILNPVAIPQQTTTYEFKVTDAMGCFATDDVTVTVVPYCIKPMEAFTPNGDGINDLWLITNGNCLKSASVQVFNRYGGKVYESKDYKNNWDGTYNGKPVADGTYYYIISYTLINGKPVYLKGNVTILR